MPALLITVLACNVAAYFLSLPDEFIDIAKSSLATISFFSNFYFLLTEIDYGVKASLIKTLLHTWSLSVEAQFYIVFPFLFSFLLTKGTRLTTLIFLLIFVYSFMLMVWTSSDSQSTAFYIFPTRAWEFLVGVLLALTANYQIYKLSIPLRNCLSLIGLSLILVPILVIDHELTSNEVMRWPSIMTLCPTFGTALVIAYGTPSTIVSKILLIKPLSALGLISYSLYLWHYPVIAFGRIATPEPDFVRIICWLVIGTILAVISFGFIEKPMRRDFSQVRFWFVLVVLLFLTTLVSSLTLYNKGFSTYERLGFDPLLVSSLQEPKGYQECFATFPNIEPGKLSKFPSENRKWCQLGDLSKQEASFILIGDSHSIAISGVLSSIGKERKLKGYYSADDGCPALIGVFPNRGLPHPSGQSKLCKYRNDEAFSLARELKIPFVILASRWDYYVDGSLSGDWNNISDNSFDLRNIDDARSVYTKAVDATVTAYSKTNSKLIVILQVAYQDINAREFLRNALEEKRPNLVAKFLRGGNESGVSLEDHRARQLIANEPWLNQGLRTLKHKFVLIDPTPLFCNQNDCPFKSDNMFFYVDQDHASTTGGLRLRKVLSEALDNF